MITSTTVTTARLKTGDIIDLPHGVQEKVISVKYRGTLGSDIPGMWQVDVIRSVDGHPRHPAVFFCDTLTPHPVVNQ